MLHHTINGTLQMPSCIYPNTISEIISDKVEPPPKQLNMPKISSTYATIHAAHYSIYALHNQELEIPLVNIGNSHKEALISIAEFF